MSLDFFLLQMRGQYTLGSAIELNLNRPQNRFRDLNGKYNFEFIEENNNCFIYNILKSNRNTPSLEYIGKINLSSQGKIKIIDKKYPIYFQKISESKAVKNKFIIDNYNRKIVT